jgi:hypothetical protein
MGVTKSDGRYRMLPVTPDTVLDCLMLQGQWPDFMHRLAVELPDDVEIEGVYWNDDRRAFTIRLHSSTFDPVPDGAEIPMLEYARCKWETVKTWNLIPLADYQRAMRQLNVAQDMLSSMSDGLTARDRRIAELEAEVAALKKPVEFVPSCSQVVDLATSDSEPELWPCSNCGKKVRFTFDGFCPDCQWTSTSPHSDLSHGEEDVMHWRRGPFSTHGAVCRTGSAADGLSAYTTDSKGMTTCPACLKIMAEEHSGKAVVPCLASTPLSLEDPTGTQVLCHHPKGHNGLHSGRTPRGDEMTWPRVCQSSPNKRSPIDDLFAITALSSGETITASLVDGNEISSTLTGGQSGGNEAEAHPAFSGERCPKVHPVGWRCDGFAGHSGYCFSQVPSPHDPKDDPTDTSEYPAPCSDPKPPEEQTEPANEKPAEPTLPRGGWF